MKRFCKDLKEHATKIINYEKKRKLYSQMKKIKYIVSKKFVIYAKKDLALMMAIKYMIKSEIIFIVLENTEVMLIVFVV